MHNLVLVAVYLLLLCLALSLQWADSCAVHLSAFAMATDCSGSSGNAAPMEAPGEGLGAANIAHNKNAMPRGRRNSPARHRTVSDLRLLTFYGFGIFLFL